LRLQTISVLIALKNVEGGPLVPLYEAAPPFGI